MIIRWPHSVAIATLIFLFFSCQNEESLIGNSFLNDGEYLIENYTGDINISVPIIASGGVGSLEHLVEGVKIGKASAVLAASVFHFGKYEVQDARNAMNKAGIPTRK